MENLSPGPSQPGPKAAPCLQLGASEDRTSRAIHCDFGTLHPSQEKTHHTQDLGVLRTETVFFWAQCQVPAASKPGPEGEKAPCHLSLWADPPWTTAAVSA